jgi:hypothetical protein
VRLALLGPCDGDTAALARACATALDRLEADRVVYLSTDGALDDVVRAWAQLLGAELPLDERLAALLDAGGPRLALEAEHERARRRLERLHALPRPGVRVIELMHDRIVLLVDDKSSLDEEDLLPASIIVFGRGEPTVRRVGTRVFLAPGHVKKRDQGVLVLDEVVGGAPAIRATLFDVDGNEKHRETIDAQRAARLRVHGAA